MPTPEYRAGVAALAADAACISLFAAVGRRNHAEGVTLTGIATTAWPFLTGALVGWALSQGWRRPRAVVPTGLTVWIAAVGVGMLLRRLTGAGTPWSFVLLTAVVTGLLLLGWRTAAAGLSRRRRRSAP